MTRSLVLRVAMGIAALVLGSSARAGDTILPFTTDVCAGVFDAQNTIVLPNTFIAFVRCADLCKAAAKACTKLTRDAFACQSGLISDNLGYSKRECENATDPPTRKACQLVATSNAATARNVLKSELADALPFCATWRDECLTACGM
jgi:hypothetical protein